MKTWENPTMVELNANLTAAGGLGGAGDGVVFTIQGFQLIGTSGPDITGQKGVKRIK